MESFNSPRGHDPLDHTTPYSSGQPYGAGPGEASGPLPGQGTAPAGRRGRVTRLVAGLGLVALLAGGAIAGVRLAGAGTASAGTVATARAGAPAGAAMALTTNLAGSATAQDALGAALGVSAQSATSAAAVISATAMATGAGHPRLARGVAGLRRCIARARHLRATGHRAAARATLRTCLRRYRRLVLRFLGALHGQFTIRTKAGTKTIAFERGVVQADASSSITVRAADGTTWTWNLTARTAVVRARHRVGAGALATGQHVFVIGPVAGGADGARLVVILG